VSVRHVLSEAGHFHSWGFMSIESEHLRNRISELLECSNRLRDLLQRYEAVNAELADNVGRGESADIALGSLRAPMRRRDVTETLEEFDGARHEVRLALALCLKDGVSRSEVGRYLGISRQLASRLAAEAERKYP